jgi:prevent-host-death family protein
VAFYLEKVNKNKRPLIITQNGKSAAILLGVSEYDSLIEKIEILEEVKLAEKQISDGFGLPHSTVKKRLLKRISK